MHGLIPPGLSQNCMTLVDVLEQRAYISPQRLAYEFLLDGTEKKVKLTYAELDAKAKLIAMKLQETMQLGDRALLIYSPGLELIAALWGCFYAGVIAVLTYPPTDKRAVDKLQLIIHDAMPSVILTDDEIGRKLLIFNNGMAKESHEKATKTDYELFFLGNSLLFTNILSSSKSSWVKPNLCTDDLALLQYTSGSTGDPKGVMLSHGNLLQNLLFGYSGIAIQEGDTIVSWTPPYHDLGLIWGILLPCFANIPASLLSPLYFLQNPLMWLKLIESCSSALSPAPNFAYDYCVAKITPDQKKDLSLVSWKFALNGGEPIRPETIELFTSAFQDNGFTQNVFSSAYGLAESTLGVSYCYAEPRYRSLILDKKSFQNHVVEVLDQCSVDSETQRVVSCGQINDVVKIVHPDTLALCKSNEIGEIWTSGPSVAQGYWQKPELTETVFHARIHSDATKKTYLRTGDLGFIYNNDLYITGRLKDILIIRGCNFYPQDIEYIVSHCHSSIRHSSVAAFSLATDDELLAIVAEIAQQTPAEMYSDIFRAIYEAVMRECKISLASIFLVAPKMLPKTTSGKVRRQPCKQMLQQGRLPVIGKWQLENELQTTLEFRSITINNNYDK